MVDLPLFIPVRWVDQLSLFGKDNLAYLKIENELDTVV